MGRGIIFFQIFSSILFPFPSLTLLSLLSFFLLFSILGSCVWRKNRIAPLSAKIVRKRRIFVSPISVLLNNKPRNFVAGQDARLYHGPDGTDCSFVSLLWAAASCFFNEDVGEFKRWFCSPSSRKIFWGKSSFRGSFFKSLSTEWDRFLNRSELEEGGRRERGFCLSW